MMTEKYEIKLSICLIFCFTISGLAQNNSSKKIATNVKEAYPNKKVSSSGQPLNIVLIVGDDVGYGDIGAYGAKKILTPNIDSLAARGVRFTDAHSSSALCSPSRYSIMTGRYPWRTRLQKGVVPSWDKPLIHKGRMTLASMLKEKGYYTAGVGKWHLGFNWPLKKGEQITSKQLWSEKVVKKINWTAKLSGGPTDYGFDYYYGIPGSLNMIPYVIIENNRVTQPPLVHKIAYDTDWKNALKAPNWSTKLMGAKMTEKAVSIINAHFAHDKKQPLFLYFPTTSIHRPDIPNFTKGWSDAGLHGDLVAQFDWQVGQVVQALKQNGQLKNTLIIVTSDNGPRPGDSVPGLGILQGLPAGQRILPKDYLSGKYHPTLPYSRTNYGAPWMIYGHHTAGKLMGFKNDPWEGGHRVPFIVYWPNKIKKHRLSNDMFCLSDLLATFADITQQKLPENAGEDSDDMLPVFLGTNKSPIRKTMVNTSGWGDFTIRKGKWKLIDIQKLASQDTHYPSKIGVGPELYDLKKDLQEKNNVFDKHPQLVKEMRQLLQRYKEQGYSTNRLSEH